MKKILCVLISIVTACTYAQNTVYTEKGELTSFDFEEIPTDYGWRTYDLDGKSTYLFSKPCGWYMAYEGTSENGVCAATSLFNYDVDYENFVTPITIPANDWLFSPAVKLPEDGSFLLKWDMCSANVLSLEDYEVRVIDAKLLDKLEAGFTGSMTLAQVSDIMLGNSTLLTSVVQESAQWTTHTLDINAYRGKEICFIWRYTSNHSSVIYLDNFRIVEQASRSISTEIFKFPHLDFNYSQVPSFMLGQFSDMEIGIRNVDMRQLTDLNVEVKIAQQSGNILYHSSFKQETLEPRKLMALSDVIGSDISERMIAEPYYFVVKTQSANGFEDVFEQKKESDVKITDCILAWDRGADASFSIGSSEGEKKIGQRFPVWEDCTAKSVEFIVADSCTAKYTQAFLYEVSDEGDYNLLTQSAEVTLTPGNEVQYQVDFESPVTLKAGKSYFVALSEPSGEFLRIGSSKMECKPIAAIYTDREKHWVEKGYNYVFCIRLVLDKNVTAVSSQVALADVSVYVNDEKELVINGKGLYQLVDVNGRVICRGYVDGYSVLRRNIPSGVYFIRINGQTRKVIL